MSVSKLREAVEQLDSWLNFPSPCHGAQISDDNFRPYPPAFTFVL